MVVVSFNNCWILFMNFSAAGIPDLTSSGDGAI